MSPESRFLVRGVDVANRRGKAVGVRLVQVTEKRSSVIHPKHLVPEPWHDCIPTVPPTHGFLARRRGCRNGGHLGAPPPHLPLDRRLRVSFGLYPRLNGWKREAALLRPEDTAGLHAVARRPC